MCDYEKDYMKTKFNSDDDLPLNKPLKFHLMTITLWRVLSFNDYNYLKLLFLKIVSFIRKFFLIMLSINLVYKLLEYDRIDISEGIDANKTSLLKEYDICHFGILKILVLSMNTIFAMVAII